MTSTKHEVALDVEEVKKDISFLCVSGPHLSPSVY